MSNTPPIQEILKMELTTGGTVEDLLDKAPYKGKPFILEGVYNCLERRWPLHQTTIQAAALALPHCYDDLTRDLRTRCRILAAPVIHRAVSRILRKLNQDNQAHVQDDFAKRGLNFVDQLSIMQAKRWPMDSVFFGFKQYLDELIEAEVASLNEAERLYIDYRDIGQHPFGESIKRLPRDIEDALDEAISDHYQTARIQRFVAKAKL